MDRAGSLEALSGDCAFLSGTENHGASEKMFGLWLWKGRSLGSVFVDCMKMLVAIK
jgi:hypothetical protein